MYREATLNHEEAGKPRPGAKSNAAVNAIVRAAYRKFARGGNVRRAVEECFRNSGNHAKRKEQP